MASAGATRLDWLLFLVLGGIWGSSYLFIKVGVDAGLPPLTLVMLRLAIGFALLATVVAVARERLPRDARTYGHLLVLAVLSIAVPFWLIASAEQTVDSALAATINAAIPLVVRSPRRRSRPSGSRGRRSSGSSSGSRASSCWSVSIRGRSP
jgi:drug/metabolite transporter (DMT)-like permease